MRAARALLAAVLALGLTGAGADALRDWVARTPLPPLAVSVGTEVLAEDGSLLRAFQVEDGRWRLAPPAEGVDPGFVAMLLAWEDARFASHHGIDARAVLRAGAQALLHRRVVSGASTLTMQVARLLEAGPTGSLAGKLRQARLALALEQRLTKDQILNLYLTLAPYGGNVEGVRAAALMWFGKDARRLTPAEAALLVALPQAPEARRPDRPASRQAALAARNRVIDRAEAAGLLTLEDAASARATLLPLRARPFPALAPLLASRLLRETPGVPRIATTIDAGLQRSAEALLARAAAGRGERLSGAVMIADHRSGAILAEVGAANWSDEPSAGFVDMTQALRSPGSTLKPFVYALAFDAGLAHPETLIEDRPAIFGRWQPQNFDNRFRGTVTVRRALSESLNLPVVRLAEALGPARIAAGLRRAGLRVETRGAPGLAVVLGGAGVRLADLVAGYGALARGGAAMPLHARAGETAPEGAPIASRVASFYVTQILAANPPPGGSAPGRVAWKTGTSYGHRDTLAIGYDGALVIGVWLGRPDGTPVPGAFGADLAAPLLFDLFDAAATRSRALPAPPPEALLLPTAALPRRLRHFGAAPAAPAPHASGEVEGVAAAAEALTIVFPPDGAELAPRGPGAPPMVARLRGGQPPYTWLLDGQPIGRSGAEIALPDLAPGFADLAVIDAAGRSRRSAFRVPAVLR